MLGHSVLLRTTAICVLVSLTACGGSGSGGITSPITGTPVAQTSAPTPPPTPTPTPPNFDTAEYRRSDGLDNINALAAYEAGGTGQGVIIAVVDSGIDVNNSEFTGRIHPDSTNTANPSAGLQDQDGHGTFVAAVAAGDNNGIGSHGIAFDAQILALRTDRGDSCTNGDGCSHFDSDIAAAIDVAIDAGAKVVNMSLGGGGANSLLRSTIDRATQAGIIHVISAGNDGASEPDAFARVAETPQANGRVLIAGYVDDNNVIATASNRAGGAAEYFVVAPGDRILAMGLNGDQFLVSGSSFSAPHVAGAIAVLYDLFPNLTADDMIDLVTSTATDLGAPGVDSVYGHGLINLEEAIQPQGAMQTQVTLTGGIAGMATFNAGVQNASAFGDAVSSGLTGIRTVATDRFRRPYEIDLAPFAQSQQPQVGLSAVLNSRQHIAQSSIGTADGTFFAQVSLQEDQPLPRALLDQFSGAFADLADQRTVSGRVTMNFGDLRLQTAFGARPASMLDVAEQQDLISLRDTDFSSHTLGNAPVDSALSFDYAVSQRLDIGMSAGWAARRDPLTLNASADMQFWQSAISASYHATQDTSLAFSIGAVVEHGQVFGAQADNGALSLASGTQGIYAQASMRHWITATAHIIASASYGSAQLDTPNQASLISANGPVGLSSWSVALNDTSVLRTSDALSLRISQPQRVESGTATLSLVGQTPSQFALNPTGRQIDSEIAYQLPLFGFGTVSANALVRRDLGHISGNHDVAGFLRFTSGF